MSYDRPDYSPDYIPLPYDLAYHPLVIVNLADNASVNLLFTHLMWGAGRDCYLYGITVEARDVAPFATLYHEGFRFLIRTPTNYFFRKTYHPTPIEFGGTWYYDTTEYFATPYKLLSTETMTVELDNACGINMDRIAVNLLYLAI